VDAVFLHETEAAVILFDLLGFTRLGTELAPLDLGLMLSRYYAHCEGCIENHGGRLVKFAGDAVLGVWLADETTRPGPRALASVAAARKERSAFLARCRAEGIAELDYTVAVAVGPVLVGQIGTARHKSFDILGETVNAAFNLAAAAQARGVNHLIAMPPDPADPADPADDDDAGTLVEVEGIELGGKPYRLHRLRDPS
jgi:class 3 adenylate cyclase